jgi:pseudouridine kinase
MDVFAAMSAHDLDRGLTGGAQWLFLDCNLPAAVFRHGLGAAARAGARVAVDAVSTAKVARLPGDLTGIAVLFCNGDEARAFLTDPVADDADAASCLVDAGAEAVVLTRGAEGVYVADAAGVREHAAEPADVVDVTGAGDALVAGTIAGLLAGYALDDAALAGVRLAALTVASDQSVLTDLPDVQELLS